MVLENHVIRLSIWVMRVKGQFLMWLLKNVVEVNVRIDGIQYK